MSDENKKELEWYELPGTPPEQRETVEELISQIKVLKIAGNKISTRYLIRLFTVIVVIGFNGYIMYMEWGSPQMAFVYIYSLVNILIGFDALSSAKKLRDISQEIKPIKKKIPKHCGHCGKPLDYIKEKTG